MRFKLKISIGLLSILLLSISVKLNSQGVINIRVKKLIDLNPIFIKLSIEPKILLNMRKKIFVKNLNDDFFLMDNQKHRIIMISKRGKIKKIFGYIGTDKKGLYYPKALSIRKSILYTVTSSVKKTVLKGFSLKNENEIIIIPFAPRGVTVSSLSVVKDKFYVGLRKPNPKDSNQDFITVYNMNGELENSFGHSIRCQTWAGNLLFNRTNFTYYKGVISGALWSQPVIFSYNVSGKKIFKKNLLDYNLRIINYIQDLIIKRKFDRPKKTYNKNGKLMYSTFCQSMDIDNKFNMYYSTWMWEKDGYTPTNPVIYVFNKHGEYIKKLILRMNGYKIKADYLLIDREKSGIKHGIFSFGKLGKEQFFIGSFKANI
jgi:hypothetical protein